MPDRVRISGLDYTVPLTNADLPTTARALGMHPAGAQTALACSTRLTPRVRRLENSPSRGCLGRARSGAQWCTRGERGQVEVCASEAPK